MCFNCPGIKLEQALGAYKDKIEHLSSYADIVHATAKLVISRRRKNENVSFKCQKMKYARAKRAKILFSIVKYANLWCFCCRRLRGCLSSLKIDCRNAKLHFQMTFSLPSPSCLLKLSIAIDGPTERISSFVDYILQPIAKAEKSYLKDTTDFINFIEPTKIPKNTTLVSMDVTSLYTNIPQEEGITTVRKAYEAFYNRNIPIPTNSIKEMLQLILGENSFSFNGRNYLQTHGTAMDTKMAVDFANIFMSEVETEILKASDIKPLQWKRYIDDVFSLWVVREIKSSFLLKRLTNTTQQLNSRQKYQNRKGNKFPRYHNL